MTKSELVTLLMDEGFNRVDAENEADLIIASRDDDDPQLNLSPYVEAQALIIAAAFA